MNAFDNEMNEDQPQSETHYNHERYHYATRITWVEWLVYAAVVAVVAVIFDCIWVFCQR